MATILYERFGVGTTSDRGWAWWHPLLCAYVLTRTNSFPIEILSQKVLREEDSPDNQS